MLTEKEVIHCAKLARLKLTNEEIKIFTGQLDKILEYVAKINEADVKDIEPTAHILPLKNVTRDDESQNKTLPVDEALKMAPEKEKNFFTVPKVI